MRSSCREDVAKRYDALRDAVSDVLELSYDALTTPEHLALLERLEHEARRLPVSGHALINQLSQHADETELGGKLAPALANRLRITRAEASRRIHEAADLGERMALTGEPLEPALPATAEAQRNGELGAGHVAVIRSFVHRLPDFVDIETRAKAEAQLARLGTQHRPDELAKLADKLTDCLNPDGDFTDDDRAKRRGITIGRQDIDGMSAISGYLTPEARATIDAVFAKLAAPGMCNSADDQPCTSGTPSHAAIQADTRSAGQRNHDALLAAARALLASGDLGQHNGLPASIIVTTTLHELEKGAGKALTGGGTLLPMSRRDPAGRPRTPLPGHLRQRQSPGALSHQTPRLTGPANCVVRQGSWLHVPRLHRARLPLRSPPQRPLRHQPGHRCQRPQPHLPPQPRTRRTRLDHPQKQPRPNRVDPTRHTSTTANHGSTPSTTPKNCYRTTTKRIRETCATRRRTPAVVWRKSPRFPPTDPSTAGRPRSTPRHSAN